MIKRDRFRFKNVWLAVAFLLLVGFSPTSTGSAFDEIQEQTPVDSELLYLVRQGWRKAFENSGAVRQVQATSRMSSDTQPGVIAVEVHSFAVKGNKRLYASSHNGHMGDLKAKISWLRLFDGNNDVMATSADLFQVAASDQEHWSVQSLNQSGETNPLIERMFSFVHSAGIQIAHSAFSLDYFDLDSPHVVIKEVRPESNSESSLVSILLEVDREKYTGNNPMVVLEVRMKLDPKYDYLPIHATSRGLGGMKFTDHFEYQPFQNSFYLKTRKGTSSAIKDGRVVSEGYYDQEIRLFSTEAPADSVFRLATYGLTEPKPLTPIDNGFRSWHLILAGVVIIAIGLAVRHYNTRRNQ